jgi:hypothetical protein
VNEGGLNKKMRTSEMEKIQNIIQMEELSIDD